MTAMIQSTPMGDPVEGGTPGLASNSPNQDSK
jgi:hypothetical protein